MRRGRGSPFEYFSEPIILQTKPERQSVFAVALPRVIAVVGAAIFKGKSLKNGDPAQERSLFYFEYEGATIEAKQEEGIGI